MEKKILHWLNIFYFSCLFLIFVQLIFLYGQDSYSPWERVKNPNTNQSESVHASWLAGEGGIRKISLFDACVTDVINSYMQYAKYLGFETGRYMGTLTWKYY